MAAETSPTSYYGNLPKFLVSYFKSMYGEAATKENDFGYDWHPKILGDHSHIATFAAMADGKVKGMCCVGQNPATSLNGGATRLAMRQLDWLVVRSEEHTSELQSRLHLVCRLLLEKKKKTKKN